jgi:hypothetical protein
LTRKKALCTVHGDSTKGGLVEMGSDLEDQGMDAADAYAVGKGKWARGSLSTWEATTGQWSCGREATHHGKKEGVGAGVGIVERRWPCQKKGGGVKRRKKKASKGSTRARKAGERTCIQCCPGRVVIMPSLS